MSDLPWYHRGLNFQCTACGDCCTGAPGYVWVNKAEIEAVAALLKMDVARFEKKYVRLVGIRKSFLERKNGDCVFFDSQLRQCKVYAARPQQCRTWPFWDSNLNSPAAWDEAASHCPGCNRGPVVAFAEIELQRKARRV
jgi:uncharacterized protein